ncbi:DUF6894 family protein [Bradyrhizobium stylosanthis]|uniref:DUF6894 family protein n=1 Tax=Bradyrhizobium stylosanthis TaxID=1803665 RepID=UPI003D318C6A
MARYYFDLRDGTELFPDEEGVQLLTLQAAEMEAMRALGGMFNNWSRRRKVGIWRLKCEMKMGRCFRSRSCSRSEDPSTSFTRRSGPPRAPLG